MPSLRLCNTNILHKESCTCARSPKNNVDENYTAAAQPRENETRSLGHAEEKGTHKNSSAQAEHISNMATVTIPNPSDVTPAGRAPTPRWNAPGRRWRAFRDHREDQVFLVLTLLIGAIVGLVVVAFILITERFGARLYPVASSMWRRLLVTVAGSLTMGYLLYR